MAPAAKRAKHHEAQMIPGVDGHRIFGFPNSIITKIRYCDTKVLTGTTGARALKVFCANGIYDPDISDTGHQPMYRDNYASIYGQYTILGSKITVSYYPQSSLDSSLIGIIGDDDSTISSNVIVCMEQNNSVSTQLGTTGCPVVVLTSTYEPLENIGVDTKDDGFSMTPVGENPDDIFCYGIWAASTDGSSTVSVNCKIEIEYTVKFAQLLSPTEN